jgi:hypothetical protein
MADSVPHAAPDGAGPARPDVLAALVEDLGNRHSFRLDGRDPHRALRYIAVARSFDVPMPLLQAAWRSFGWR